MFFSNFIKLRSAIEQITGKKVEVKINPEIKKILNKLANEGKCIVDFKKDNLVTDENNILFYKLPDGSHVRVNLYIQEKILDFGERFFQRLSKEELEEYLQPLHKYHIFMCETLKQMATSGRFEKYRINTRNNGTFYYRYVLSSGKVIAQRENEKLLICKHCLKMYVKLCRKNGIPISGELSPEEFNLEEFDRKFQFFNYSESSNKLLLINTRRISKLRIAGEHLYPNVYPPDWNRIAEEIKEKRGYTCEKCGFKPSNEKEKKFIHVHHINGDRNDNREENLRVLCIKCHSEEVQHQHIKKWKEYREFLKLISNKRGEVE